MADKIVPFMEGRNGRLVIMQDNVPKSYPMRSYRVRPVVTKHADGVCGEQRDRLSVTLNHYEGSFEMYEKDAEWLRDWLAAQSARDAMTVPLDQQGALRFQPNNGTKQSFLLEDVTIDDWELSRTGRSEKGMVTVNWRCTDIKEVKSV